jgi:hypothetical protein
VSFDKNVYCIAGESAGGATDLRVGGLPLEQWRADGKDRHSTVADPKFVNPAAEDFNLKPDSPARDVGFVPFDQADVGPR